MGWRTSGKAAIEAFLRRFVDVGLKGEVHDILVNGPPWRTTTVVYENRAVLFGRAVWGKIVYQEDFEDTCKADAFDVYLESQRHSEN